MKILISYDGSEYANAALKDMLRAGLPTEAQAVVMSIPKSSFPAPDGARNGNGKAPELASHSPAAYSEEEIEATAAMAKQASEMIRENFPAWEVRADLAVGSAVRTVAKKVSQWNPNLIILGLQAGAENGRKRFGGVSRRIAVEAKCSVRVARGFNDKTEEAPRVLLCVDGSPYTEAAVQTVAARDWPKGTEVRILTVVDPFDYSIPEFVAKALEQAKALHRIVAAEFHHSPAFTSSAVRAGDPKKVILTEVAEWEPDSIFLAPHRINRFRRFLMGGVAGTVMTHANCAVELVKAVKPSARSASILRLPAPSPAYD